MIRNATSKNSPFQVADQVADQRPKMAVSYQLKDTWMNGIVKRLPLAALFGM
jgi:hypothetical protein